MMSDALFRQDVLYVCLSNRTVVIDPNPTPSEAPNTGSKSCGYTECVNQAGSLAGLITSPKSHSRYVVDLAICHVHNDPGIDI